MGNQVGVTTVGLSCNAGRTATTVWTKPTRHPFVLVFVLPHTNICEELGHSKLTVAHVLFVSVLEFLCWLFLYPSWRQFESPQREHSVTGCLCQWSSKSLIMLPVHLLRGIGDVIHSILLCNCDGSQAVCELVPEWQNYNIGPNTQNVLTIIIAVLTNTPAFTNWGV